MWHLVDCFDLLRVGAASFSIDDEARVVDFSLHEGALLQTNTESVVVDSLEYSVESCVVFVDAFASDDDVVQVPSSSAMRASMYCWKMPRAGFTPRGRRLRR
ncbi:hypothetical protein Y032_0246g41 [Ancylostoma ceylanicum]|uniref:Uncharacterized protein n=1 Tax=Ancylostoma ceylanicum TaxID=53326 RepID=A0A016SCT3_9BILA|nr:hypothetical protein Y032_0246g41 [Ancylostoma ceylanicum]